MDMLEIGRERRLLKKISDRNSHEITAVVSLCLVAYEILLDWQVLLLRPDDWEDKVAQATSVLDFNCDIVKL